MSRKLLKFIAKVKDIWLNDHDPVVFQKNYRRIKIKEISNQLLEEPLNERLDMLKRIEHIVLIESNKQKLDFKEMYDYWNKHLNNYIQ